MTSTELVSPTYTATGIASGLCATPLPACSVQNPSNATSGQSDAFAQILLNLDLLTLGSESLLVAPTTPLSTTPFSSGLAGFLLSTPNQLLNLSLLQGLTITTMLDGAPVQSYGASVSSLDLLSLIDVGNNPNEAFVYFATTPGENFDSLELTDTADVATVLSTVNVYGACVANPVLSSSSSGGGSSSSGASSSSSGASSSSSGSSSGASSSSSGASSSSSGASGGSSSGGSGSSSGGVADQCGIGSTSTTLLSPSFAASDSFSGLCALLGSTACNVTSPGNVTSGQSDAFTAMNIEVGLVGLGSESLIVSPAAPLLTPFSGGVAGFVVADPNQALTLSLLQGLTVTTLRNGAVVESASVGNSTLDVLSLIDAGNVPETFVYFAPAAGAAFDSLELTNSAGVATVLNTLDVYNACVAPLP